MDAEDNRLRLTILGGFLGAGKSTWLRHQLYAKTYDQPHVIVNEVATHAVDDILLAKARHLDVLAGGCVCCDQADEMIKLLRRICNDRSRKQHGPQTSRLVFEMSGVADPGKVMKAIQDDPVLARHILLDEIIVVVDALYGLEQLKTETLARAQIETADRIVIAKIDAGTHTTLASLMATLQKMNATCSFTGCAFGVEAPLPSLSAAAAVELPKLCGQDENEPLSSLPLNLEDFRSDGDIWVGFSIWLSAMLHTHGDRLVRVKGVVRTPTGRLLLQSVRRIMQTPERMPAVSGGGERPSDNTVVLIGRGLDADRILASLRQTLKKTLS